MWNYEKRLQYPISISTPNAKMASFIISQYGGLYYNTLESIISFVSLQKFRQQ